MSKTLPEIVTAVSYRAGTDVAERSRIVAALGATIAVWVVATLGSSPGLAALDAGDFVTAGADLGVPHPTGFPTYTMLAHLASRLPLGDIAGRIAWTSAAWSAVAAGLMAWLVASYLRLGAGALLVGAGVAMAFTTADTLVMHARVPEVYALNLALVTTALFALDRLRATGDVRWCFGAALACGIGLSNHVLFALWAPIFAVAAIATVPRGRRARAAGASVLLGAAALLAYAYLPAAAVRPPAHNWGDPSNLERWWAHVSAASIRGAYGDEMGSGIAAAWTWFRLLGRQVWSGLGWLGPVGLVGAALMAARGRWRCAVLLACIGMEIVYATLINPMGIRDFQNGQLVALFVAAAGSGLIAVGAERANRLGLVAGAALLASMALLCLPGRFGDSARDRALEDLALIHLGLAAPDAVSLPVSDSLTASLLYADVVLDARPDMAIVGRSILSDGQSAPRVFAAQPFDLVPPERLATWGEQGRGNHGARADEILSLSVAAREVYWEPTGRGDELPPGWSLEHRWPVGVVVSAGTEVDACRTGTVALCGPGLDANFAAGARTEAGRLGYAYRRWLARQWGYRGARAFATGRYPDVGPHFERARALMPDNPAWTTGVAVGLANVGRLDEALRVQLDAISLNPMSAQAVDNAISFAEGLGDHARAERLRRNARRLGLAVSPAPP